MVRSDCATRQKIMEAALKEFAHSGYRGASVQAIVDGARVTKPTLYYYFSNKAALYKALVDSAHDERFHLMQQAAEKGKTLEEKLVEIITALFGFLETNRELIRLTFASAFASPGELPADMDYREKPQRNFDFLQSLMKRELAAGRLDREFSADELTLGIWGLMNIYVMRQLVLNEQWANRKTAENIVELFLAGATAKKK